MPYWTEESHYYVLGTGEQTFLHFKLQLRPDDGSDGRIRHRVETMRIGYDGNERIVTSYNCMIDLIRFQHREISREEYIEERVRRTEALKQTMED